MPSSRQLAAIKFTDNVGYTALMGKDNGICQKVSDKIFQPFFITRPTGQGTGLGLSLSYDAFKVQLGEFRYKPWKVRVQNSLFNYRCKECD